MEYWDIVDAKGNKTGKVHPKDQLMSDGVYHLSVSVWITDGNGRFLISQRAENKAVNPGMWETTGGSALSGESSLQAALRETSEELGIELSPQDGEIFKKYTWPHSNGHGGAYIEVWVFQCDVELSSVVLQKEEAQNAAWADRKKLKALIAEGKFINYTYLDELFASD